MVFSLSVNVTELGFVVRDHPSGIEIVKPPRLDVKGTKAMLSGMSPGGLSSGGTGDSEGIGVSDTVAPGDAVALGDSVDPLPVPEELVPPHAERTMAAASVIGVSERVRLRMPASFGRCIHPLYAPDREGSIRIGASR
jgi:hypothetical protein